MFTGIIENTGTVKKIIENGHNKTIWIESTLANELRVDQSLSHDGVCLTVEETGTGMYKVTAIEETLSKTTIGKWQNGTIINLERCMSLQARLDGHIVQGHVDGTAKCIAITEKHGSWEYRFLFDNQFAALVIEKGAVTINGISLTCFDVSKTAFTVAIIPYTFQHTNLQFIKIGDEVNIEWDIIGKYITRLASLKEQ